MALEPIKVKGVTLNDFHEEQNPLQQEVDPYDANLSRSFIPTAPLKDDRDGVCQAIRT